MRYGEYSRFRAILFANVAPDNEILRLRFSNDFNIWQTPSVGKWYGNGERAFCIWNHERVSQYLGDKNNSPKRDTLQLKRVSGVSGPVVESEVHALACVSHRSENERVPEWDEVVKKVVSWRGTVERRRRYEKEGSRNCVSIGKCERVYDYFGTVRVKSDIAPSKAPLRRDLRASERASERVSERRESCLGLSLWSVTPRQYAVSSSLLLLLLVSYHVVPQWSWSDSCVPWELRGNETWKSVAAKKILRLRCSVRAIKRKVRLRCE